MGFFDGCERGFFTLALFLLVTRSVNAYSGDLLSIVLGLPTVGPLLVKALRST